MSPRPRRVTRALRVLLAGAAALVILTLLSLPPRPRAGVAPAAEAGGPSVARATVRGAYHIHTNRSDGTGSIDEVAAAAARAGLQFIILTDHGDGTRPPLAPAVRQGVLCLDGVEISTNGGHYVALGLTGAAPYRLAGDSRDVVEDVRRLGGFGVAAHPDSPKAELQWSDWQPPIDGVEWLNADTEWRDESRGALARALLTYPWRPAETLGALISHTRTTLRRWDDLARTRRIVGVAGVDAHARIGVRDGPDPYRGRVLARAPSYEASFRAFALHLELDAALTGDAARDAEAVLAAIRAGHVYTTVEALAIPGAVAFEASTGDRRARMGDFLDLAAPSGDDAAAIASTGSTAATGSSREASAVAPSSEAAAREVVFRARVEAPPDATLRLMCDGQVAAEAPATDVLNHRYAVAAGASPAATAHPAACRLEAGWEDGNRRVTWLVTNPIYLRASDPPIAPALAPAGERLPDAFTTPDAWKVEHDPRSTAAWRFAPAPAAPPAVAPAASVPAAATSTDSASAATASVASAPTSASVPLAPGARVVEFAYQLHAGERASQYAALVSQQPPPTAGATRVAFRARADKPMRLSVQLRRGDDGVRWQRSVYLDTTPREVRIAFDDMRVVPPATSADAHPSLDRIHAVLFVIDTIHTQPGVSGVVTLEDIHLER